jgi:hypothetical protein
MSMSSATLSGIYSSSFPFDSVRDVDEPKRESFTLGPPAPTLSRSPIFIEPISNSKAVVDIAGVIAGALIASRDSLNLPDQILGRIVDLSIKVAKSIIEKSEL